MKTQILVICRHLEILATVVRLVNNNPDWNAAGAATDEEAIGAFDAQPFDLVLLGSGIPRKSDEQLRAYFTAKKPDIVIVQHYGGGSGLLTAEIYEALK
jgi:2-phospho-L-lactate guanylyltransferase (CobY/MobA/RfbA family)